MNTKRGILSTIVLIIIALIILGYYNISFKSVVESPNVQENLMYAWKLTVWGATQAWDWIMKVLPDQISQVKIKLPS